MALTGSKHDLSLLSPRIIEDSAKGNGGKLHDEIYEQLQHALITGGFVPGQVFSMRTLADECGTSLIPVRDALKRLVAQNVLALEPNRAVYVPLMDRDRFQEILRVRLTLETDIARRAAELIDIETIARMAEFDAGMQASVNDESPRNYLAMNYNFHFTLYESAGSVVALPIVRSLWMQVGPFLNFLFRTRGTKNAKDNHAEVMRALRRRDSLGVAEAIRNDLSDAADVILSREEFVAPLRTRADRGWPSKDRGG